MQVTPTTPKGLRTRLGILQAARRVFARDGYVATRMSDVAQEAGLSLGGLYRYFENKQDLFAELIGNIFEELYSVSRAQLHNLRADPYLALHESNIGYLRHYFEYRDVMRVLVEAATVDRDLLEKWWRMRDRYVQRFISVVMTAYGPSELRNFDMKLATGAMACMVEQAAYVWFAQGEFGSPPVDVEEAATVLSLAWYRMFFGSDPDQARPSYERVRSLSQAEPTMGAR